MSTTTRAPSRSALSSLISSDSPTTQQSPTAGLTAQILHNLQHQHLWTSLRVYDPLTLSPTQCIPLISGFPLQAIYTHPDEQAYMLEHGIRGEDVPVERVWVLPTTQGQLWSLRQLAGIFDALPNDDLYLVNHNSHNNGSKELQVGRTVNDKLAEYEGKKREKVWGGKRALLAMVNRCMGGDGTVVYYVILEGNVKPRQN